MIEKFKYFKEPEILEWVAKSWKNRGLLFQNDAQKRMESIAILENLLKHFELEEMKVVVNEKLEAYNSLA